MKANPSLPLNPQIEDVRRYVEENFKVMNSISFGDGTNRSEQQNTDTVFLSGTSNAAANTETGFDHKLGRTPIGFILINQDKAGVFYKGATAWDNSKIYLKCDVASVAFTVILL